MSNNNEFALRYAESSKVLESLIKKIGVENMKVDDWLAAVGSGKMKESTMTQYIDYIDPEYISFFYRLSQTFISKHKDILDWGSISRFQNIVSIDFINEHLDYVSLDLIVHNNSNFSKSKDMEQILDLYNKLKDNEKYKTLWENIESTSFIGRDRSHYRLGYKINNSSSKLSSNQKDIVLEDATPVISEVKSLDIKPTRKKREFKYEKKTREELKNILTKRKIKFKSSDSKEILVQLCKNSAK